MKPLFVLDRSGKKIEIIRQYLHATRQMRNYGDELQDPKFTQTITLDLATVVTSVSGPKRPHDRVSVSEMKQDFDQ